MSEQLQMEPRPKKGKVLLVIGAIIGALIVAYVGFSIFFQSHFFIGTSINGIPASFASVDGVKAKIVAGIDDYSLTVVEADGTEERISGPEAGLDIDPESGEIEGFLAQQNGFAWVSAIFEPTAYVGEHLVTYDPVMLRSRVNELHCVTRSDKKEPVDATYMLDGDVFIIVKEKSGTTTNPSTLTIDIGEKMRCLGSSLDLMSNGSYEQPKILSDSPRLIQLVDDLNARLMTVTYEEGEVIEKDKVASWLLVDDRMRVSYDEEAIARFVERLAERYTTAGKDKQLETSYGTIVTVPGGNYGWKVDAEGELAQLMEDLHAKQDVSREMIYIYEAASHGENDYGNSYVEINLTAQHLFLYINGRRVIESDLVSGNLAQGHRTPTGAYRVTYTQRNAVLRGEDYITPVSYWMPFNGGVGMHDATWRSAFGGNIYVNSGSHGCINLPYSVAQTIFSKVYTGFPVLVYSMNGTESASSEISAAVAVMDMINAIGEVSAENHQTVADARAAYEALSRSAKARVTNLSVLEAAEAAVNQQLNAQAAREQAQMQAEQDAANVVIGMIQSIGPMPTLDREGEVINARNAYNNLSDQARGFVGGYIDMLAEAEGYIAAQKQIPPEL